ncbi:RICIN domain-containing protein [Paenibacillus macerans]
MKNSSRMKALLLAFVILWAGVLNGQVAQAETAAIAKTPGNSNPLMDHKLGADPSALVYNGRVYIYMSSDAYEYDSNGKIKANSFSNLNKVHLISSDDMVNWTDHGAIPVAGSGGIAKWASGSWAPAAAHKKINGQDKFFLYFANSAGGIGVLTADSPIGPWTDPLGKALVSWSTPGVSGVVWLFDPAVLVDDNGSGYLYFGGGIPGGDNPTQNQWASPKTARVIKLSSDMIHIEGSAQLIDAPFFFEDSGIHKYNGKYYYSYCSNFGGNHPAGSPPPGEIAYMVSNNPMGPFTYVKSILRNPAVFFGVGGNNHHTIFNFNNKWYITYHAQTVSKALLGDGLGYRSPHINELTYSGNEIVPVQGTMRGVSQIKHLNPYQRTEAETIGWNGGILTEVSQAPGGMVPSVNMNVTDIHNGDWVAVGNADFGSTGAASFKANVASTVGGQIEIRLDSPTGQVIGTLNVTPTGGNQVWRLQETNVNRVTGVHNIYFMFKGASGQRLFNFDYWQFATSSGGEMPVENGRVYKLQNVHSNMVIGIANMSTANGGQAVQWDDNGTADHDWRFERLDSGYYKLTNIHSGKVLGIENMSTARGASAVQWDDNGTADHEWQLAPVGDGSYKLVNRHSGMVLGVDGMSREAGAKIVQWDDNGTADHNWRFMLVR